MLRLDADLHAAAKTLAADEERTLVGLIRWALRCYVARGGE